MAWGTSFSIGMTRFFAVFLTTLSIHRHHRCLHYRFDISCPPACCHWHRRHLPLKITHCAVISHQWMQTHLLLVLWCSSIDSALLLNLSPFMPQMYFTVRYSPFSAEYNLHTECIIILNHTTILWIFATTTRLLLARYAVVATLYDIALSSGALPFRGMQSIELQRLCICLDLYTENLWRLLSTVQVAMLAGCVRLNVAHKIHRIYNCGTSHTNETSFVLCMTKRRYWKCRQ